MQHIQGFYNPSLDVWLYDAQSKAELDCLTHSSRPDSLALYDEFLETFGKCSDVLCDLDAYTDLDRANTPVVSLSLARVFGELERDCFFDLGASPIDHSLRFGFFLTWTLRAKSPLS